MIEAERGYLIVASNTPDVDYIACARVLAKSLRYWHPSVKICLLTNTEYTDPVFDYVKQFPYPTVGGWADDWQVFAASPFRETVKLEADMIVTAPIEHWWTMFEHRDVVLTQGSKNFLQHTATSRHYRKIFDINHLPDIYNAITYWRVSQTAKDFFFRVRHIFENWDVYKQSLRGGQDETANTDLVYAMAASIIGVENVTLPKTSYPSLIHMKSKINNILAEDWRKQLVWELVDGEFRINTASQRYPVHYHQKDFAQELEPLYDKLLAST
jgi:hypothetical protein